MNHKQRIEEDKKGILNPESWPHHLILPVKKVDSSKFGKDDFCGVMVAGNITTVFIMNVWDAPKLLAGTMPRPKEEVFESLDKLLEVWMVD